MLQNTRLGDCSVIHGLSVASTHGSESQNPTELVLPPCHIKTHGDWKADAMAPWAFSRWPSKSVSQASGRPSSFITRWSGGKEQGCAPLFWYWRKTGRIGTTCLLQRTAHRQRRRVPSFLLSNADRTGSVAVASGFVPCQPFLRSFPLLNFQH